jgi:hypothetical protein
LEGKDEKGCRFVGRRPTQQPAILPDLVAVNVAGQAKEAHEYHERRETEETAEDEERRDS